MWACCCCQRCAGALNINSFSKPPRTATFDGSPEAVWTQFGGNVTLPASQSGSFGYCFEYVATGVPSLIVSALVNATSGGDASGIFVGNLLRFGIDWASGLPFWEPCDENGQSTGERQLTTRPDFCPYKPTSTNITLELDIFGVQGPESTIFGIEGWVNQDGGTPAAGYWYVLWQQNVPWSLDTFNAGYFGEHGANAGGLGVACGINETGQIYPETEHPLPPAWDLTATVTANDDFAPSPGSPGENGCCELASGTFRMRQTPSAWLGPSGGFGGTNSTNVFERFIYAYPAISGCGQSASWQSCNMSGRFENEGGTIVSDFVSPNPRSYRIQNYDYVLKNALPTLTPPVWSLCGIPGAQNVNPPDSSPQYLAYPSFGGGMGTGYMLDSGQWIGQGTNVLSMFGILVDPQFACGCKLPLTISVTPAWSW